MMRIISGKARATKLLTPSAESEVRPTTDRVKEAMFSAIQFEIRGKVLDLFAGTGQLGLECLSRGAEKAVFCDNSEQSLAVVRENVRRTHFEAESEILLTDYKRYLKHTCAERFDVVFLDPPYGTGLSEKALEYLSDGRLLNDGCTVVLECGVDENPPDSTGILKMKKRYTYSGVSYVVYKRTDADE